MIGLPLGIGDGGSISKESTTEHIGDPIVPYMAQILLQRRPMAKTRNIFSESLWPTNYAGAMHHSLSKLKGGNDANGETLHASWGCWR